MPYGLRSRGRNGEYMSVYLLYSYIDGLCLAMMLMTTFITLSLTKKLQYQRIYVALMFCGVALVASDLLYELHCDGKLCLPNVLLNLDNSVYFCSCVGISFLWYVYIRRLSGFGKTKNILVHLLPRIPVTLIIIMSLTSGLTGLIFYFNEQGEYVRGPLNWLHILTCLGYFIGTITWSIIGYLRRRTKDSVHCVRLSVSFLLFPALAVAFQVLNISMPVLCVGAVFGMLWVFVNAISNDREKMVAGQMAADSQATFFASMSHEIRTPINAVLGMNTMILRESKDPVITDYARTVQNSGQMLLALINDILDFSKVSSGKLTLTEGELKLPVMIKDINMMISQMAVDKQLNFSITINKQMPSVYTGDDVRLKQIIVNLLTNAIKYTSEGYVKLDISFEQGDSEDEGYLSISVKDTGKGIKPENIPNLCNPYVRIEDSVNRKIEGTGLGLSIVNRLLSMMGSELKIESKYGEGSIFYFTLKLHINDHTPVGSIEEVLTRRDTEKVSYGRFVAPGLKVLVVDDTAVNLEVFKNLLKETKIDIDAVISGRYALARCQKKKYDLIFLDHLMPDMDGIETLKRLREEENLVDDNTRIIMLTANAAGNARERFISEGFDDFVSKPVNPDELEAIIIKYAPPHLLTHK